MTKEEFLAGEVFQAKFNINKFRFRAYISNDEIGLLETKVYEENWDFFANVKKIDSKYIEIYFSGVSIIHKETIVYSDLEIAEE
ncbi:MAG: hypothetical protein Q7W13_13220 [Bacteroidia bacterium]|nr:hypothetical protein [Bacteroidia bacterium]